MSIASLRFPISAVLLALIAGTFVFAADDAPPAKLTAQQDRQRLMDLLNITTIPSHPDNNDESKADPYPNLPDPLLLKNGQKVTTAEMWWSQRRPESSRISSARFTAGRQRRRPG